MDNNFNAKLHFGFRTTQSVIQKIIPIDIFKAKYLANTQTNQYESLLAKLEHAASIQNAAASLSIAGHAIDLKDLEVLFNPQNTNTPQDKSTQVALGFYKTRLFVLQNFQRFVLAEASIGYLHSYLFQYCETKPGVSNKLISVGASENTLANLLNWTTNSFDKGEAHPLILIAAFIYEFMAMHPYQDGNGRLTRLLTTLLLMKVNYPLASCLVLDKEFEANKAVYLETLQNAQKAPNTNQVHFDGWLLFFLDCLGNAIQKLEAKLPQPQFATQVQPQTQPQTQTAPQLASQHETGSEAEPKPSKKVGSYLNERQKMILNHIKENPPIKVGDISRYFEDISINTIKKDLQYFTREELVEKKGRGKGTHYV